MRRVASAAAYALFLALCAEAALQVFYRATAGEWLWAREAIPIYQADPHSGVFNRAHLDYQHRTNEFRAHYLTNSEGFRVPDPTREFTRPKPRDTFRTMLVGASFAFGWGVDYADAVAGRLEQGLHEVGFASPARVEFMNAGVPSLPETAQRAWFEATGRSYEPDLVVQLAYGTLAIPDPPLPRARSDGYLVPQQVTPVLRARAYAKRLASVFYGFVLFSQFRGGSEIQGAGREMREPRGFSLDSLEVSASVVYFEAMRRGVEDAGARYAVLYYPLSYVIHPEDIARWRHLGVQDATAQEAFDAALCDELSRRGISCFDGTQALRKAAARSVERLYYPLDIHWTSAGNAAAAEHALGVIRQLGESAVAPTP